MPPTTLEALRRSTRTPETPDSLTDRTYRSIRSAAHANGTPARFAATASRRESPTNNARAGSAPSRSTAASTDSGSGLCVSTVSRPTIASGSSASPSPWVSTATRQASSQLREQTPAGALSTVFDALDQPPTEREQHRFARAGPLVNRDGLLDRVADPVVPGGFEQTPQLVGRGYHRVLGVHLEDRLRDRAPVDRELDEGAVQIVDDGVVRGEVDRSVDARDGTGGAFWGVSACLDRSPVVRRHLPNTPER